MVKLSLIFFVVFMCIASAAIISENENSKQQKSLDSDAEIKTSGHREGKAFISLNRFAPPSLFSHGLLQPNPNPSGSIYPPKQFSSRFLFGTFPNFPNFANFPLFFQNFVRPPGGGSGTGNVKFNTLKCF